MRAPADLVKVLVADDQTLFRTGLARMLSSDRRVEVVGQARDGEEAIEQALAAKPNVVLMDLQMPRVTGVEATRRLVQEIPGLRVLALSAYADKAMVGEALASGAVGFVDKDVSFEDILDRILSIAPASATGLKRVRAKLSHRELHVLKQVADGLSNKQIARRLGISEKTVRNHLSRVFNKLGATNRTEAVMHAMRAGMVTA
ncbi:MAG: response regulator transcription factor [Chloroflexi bacterium]|nr:MAG: response regulator transcription factor [Chloroflexota bacterium]TMF29234.1 MAG: response regulator transcription factor [Chloroflexota bacterium]TMF53849.1 MAG: response regulator transcription factor [Chloroflexota bacterium]